jgi:hypothetical protein
VIFQDVSGTGDMFVMFAGSQDISMGLHGVKRAKNSFVYLVVMEIGLLRTIFGSGKDTMPSNAPSVMHDIPL